MDRRSFLGSWTGGLLATGAGSIETDTRFVAVVLALSAVVVFLLCTGVLVFVSSRRRRRKLVKVLVTLVAGSVCGAFWILLIDTAVNPAIPDAMHEPAVLVIGVVTALVAASLLSMANRLSEMVRLSAMAMGFHSLALPIAALISIVAGGAHAVDLRAVALSIGGLLLGVGLAFVGDRRRRRRSRSRARFDLGQPYA
jgi:peptidoglycan/LPS O-acetylase OafA/YrhL